MMRTSSSPDQSPVAERGLSLIELVVVLTIVGLMALVAVPLFGTAFDAAQERSNMSELETLFLEARVTAETQGHEINLSAADLPVSGIVASRPVIRFFPDGTVSPVDLVIEGEAWHLDWLTGTLEPGALP